MQPFAIWPTSGTSAIAFLAGPHKLHSAITRENDFRTAMQAAGLPIQKKWVIECDHTLKGGVAGFEQLRKLASRPTAIVCSNDMTAIGVLRAAYMEGLRVPQDLSVIGLDDIDFAEFTLPPLTTIRLSRADLARAAFEALRSQAEDPANPKLQREFLVSTSLVVRGSTAAPPVARNERSFNSKLISGKAIDRSSWCFGQSMIPCDLHIILCYRLSSASNQLRWTTVRCQTRTFPAICCPIGDYRPLPRAESLMTTAYLNRIATAVPPHDMHRAFVAFR